MRANHKRLVLTGPARDDIRDILAYTEAQWGTAQRLDYKGRIDSALQKIMAKPETGRRMLGYRVHSIGRHIVFYRMEGKHIFVIRILHMSMDAARHLEDPGKR